jgi:hypothetical protein
MSIGQIYKNHAVSGTTKHLGKDSEAAMLLIARIAR